MSEKGDVLPTFLMDRMQCVRFSKGSRKKVIFLSAIKGGGVLGGKDLAIKKKLFELFFFCCHFKQKIFYFRQLIDIWIFHGKVCR